MTSELPRNKSNSKFMGQIWIKYLWQDSIHQWRFINRLVVSWPNYSSIKPTTCIHWSSSVVHYLDKNRISFYFLCYSCGSRSFSFISYTSSGFFLHFPNIDDIVFCLQVTPIRYVSSRSQNNGIFKDFYCFVFVTCTF